MNKYFKLGEKIYGFCNGFFGSDDYDNKICVFVTPDYAVFQYIEGKFEGNATVLNNPDELNEEIVSEWKNPQYDYE